MSRWEILFQVQNARLGTPKQGNIYLDISSIRVFDTNAKHSSNFRSVLNLNLYLLIYNWQKNLYMFVNLCFLKAFFLTFRGSYICIMKNLFDQVDIPKFRRNTLTSSRQSTSNNTRLCNCCFYERIFSIHTIFQKFSPSVETITIFQTNFMPRYNFKCIYFKYSLQL